MVQNDDAEDHEGRAVFADLEEEVDGFFCGG